MWSDSNQGYYSTPAFVYVTVGGVEEKAKAIAAIAVKGGCCVGFTQRHLVKHAATYDGAI